MAELRILLMSDMCAGNGESFGNAIDNDICTDRYGFPFIPGKRIFGCLRDTAEMLGKFGMKSATDINIRTVFGDSYGTAGKLCIENAYLPGIETMHQYIEDLKKTGKDYMVLQSTEDKIVQLFTSVRGQTKIDSDGRADDGSLRFVRVLNRYSPLNGEPLEFVSKVRLSGVNAEQRELFKAACSAFRHMGMDRNRGLGNIKVSFTEEETEAADVPASNSIQGSQTPELVRILYETVLESPIAYQEYLGSGNQIEARSVIGAFSNVYLSTHSPDEKFADLFLNGTVKWSALTPVIEKRKSDPAPFMLMKLKNDNGRLINSFACDDPNWPKKKPKTLEGFFASFDEKSGTYFVGSPESEMNYHNNLHAKNEEEIKGLYMQEAFLRGMRFSGEVIAPSKLAGDILAILKNGQLRIGRSKKTQYGTVKIINISQSVYSAGETKVRLKEQEPVFAILKSDLVLLEDGYPVCRNEEVRAAICKADSLINQCPTGYQDICRYHILSGYHAMWQMQKPKIQAVRAGSVYCFIGSPGEYQSELTIGEFQQEGMGKIEIIPFHVLKKCTDVKKGRLLVNEGRNNNEKIKQGLRNLLIIEAGKAELQEYAFQYYLRENSQIKTKGRKEKIPSGRMRQMLSDSETIEDLWNMAESMKTSDVSSESIGKKEKAKELIESFYGNDHKQIDWNRIIRDKDLQEEIHSNTEILSKLEEHWREPMFTLLHMLHYEKR